MHDEINSFGLFQIPTFGMMIAIGVLFLILLLFYYLRKFKVPESKIDTLFIVGAVSGLMFALGAYFFDALWHGIDIARTNGTPFRFDFGGITFSGGLFTCIVFYFVFYLFMMKYEKQNVFYYFDIFAIGICIAHAFGRFGCFFGGCCYGKVVEPGTFLSMLYPTEAGWQTVYPTQLFESFFLFLLFVVLVFLVKKNRTAVYLLSYNVFRFFLEYLRGDSRGASPFGALSPSQFLSIVMFVMGLVVLFFRKQIETFLLSKNKPNDEYPANDVERTGNGIFYKQKILNKLNANFSGKLIFLLMVFAITCITFGIFANGVSEKGSIRQVEKKLDQISHLTFTYNEKDYPMIPSMGSYNDKQTLQMQAEIEDSTLTYYPDLNLATIQTKDGSISSYKATYVYRYQYFTVSKEENDGRIKDFSYQNNVYSELMKDYCTQCAKYMGDLTSSPLPVIYTILIVLEIIAITLYVLFYFFGKKVFPLEAINNEMESEMSKEDNHENLEQNS